MSGGQGVVMKAALEVGQNFENKITRHMDDIIVDEILSRGFSFIYVFPDMILALLGVLKCE